MADAQRRELAAWQVGPRLGLGQGRFLRIGP